MMNVNRAALWGWLSLATVACASSHPPQQVGTAATPTAPGLRAPDAILADSVAATGGTQAWNAHHSLHVKARVTLQGMGMGGPIEHFQTNTNKSLMVTTLPGVGEVREGSNGKVFWSQDPINGIRLLEGAEAEQARFETAWNPDLEAHNLFPKIETAPDAPAGQECLVLTPPVGPPMRACYDRQTHLQLSMSGTRVTAQGEIPFTSTLSDWRTVDGLRIPFASEDKAGPMTIQTSNDQVTFDEPLDEKMFEPPSLPK